MTTNLLEFCIIGISVQGCSATMHTVCVGGGEHPTLVKFNTLKLRRDACGATGHTERDLFLHLVIQFAIIHRIQCIDKLAHV